MVTVTGGDLVVVVVVVVVVVEVVVIGALVGFGFRTGSSFVVLVVSMTSLSGTIA